MIRGSTLIFHSYAILCSRTHIHSLSPPGLSAHDPDSLQDILRYYFRSSQIYKDILTPYCRFDKWKFGLFPLLSQVFYDKISLRKGVMT